MISTVLHRSFLGASRRTRTLSASLSSAIHHLTPAASSTVSDLAANGPANVKHSFDLHPNSNPFGVKARNFHVKYVPSEFRASMVSPAGLTAQDYTAVDFHIRYESSMGFPSRIATQGYATERESSVVGNGDSLSVSKIKVSPDHVKPMSRKAIAPKSRKKQEEAESDGPRLNEKITAEYVRLVSEDGHSVVSLQEALRRAKELECDLVEVQKDAEPPVCKIVKYSLEKYKKAKVGKERAKAKRAEAIRPEVKEIRFTPKIEAKDLKFKADQALKLMESGYRVKCNAVPDKDKHKELEPEKLLELLSRFTCYIEDALVEFGPNVDKSSAVVIVRHAKFGPPKKGGVKKLKDMNIKTAARVKGESPKTDGWEAGGSTFDDQGDIEKPELTLSAKQAKPVQVQNRYAERELIKESSGGRDANRFEPRSPNQPVDPQHPRFPNQAPNQQHSERFDPQSQNQIPRPRFPNQQPTGRFDSQSPGPQHQFPNQALNQQPSGPSRNRHLDRQGPPPRFQNQAPNPQPPNPPQAPPRAPPRPQTRLPNETPNQEPSGPCSGYGIFSIPKKK